MSYKTDIYFVYVNTDYFLHYAYTITNISFSDSWRMATEKFLLTISRTVPVQYAGLNADIVLQKDTDINLGTCL